MSLKSLCPFTNPATSFCLFVRVLPQAICQEPPLDPPVMSQPMPVGLGPAPPTKVVSNAWAALHSTIEFPSNAGGVAAGYPKSVKSWSRGWLKAKPAPPTV